MFYLDEGLSRVSGVGPDDQTRVLAALDDSLLQLVSPDVLAGVEDVVAVADHRHRHRGELVQDPLKRLLLPASAPRDDGAARHEERKSQENIGLHPNCCCGTLVVLQQMLQKLLPLRH